MNNDFYKVFEDKHRGSRELIKSRLHAYLPFINPLNELYQHSQTVDLGCGRGEWLELLTDKTDFEALGVDLDDGMLAECEQHKLYYKRQDALTLLKSLSGESQALITAFHLVEHISFTDLQELVQQALRVLKPAGLLILETPNPENIVVGTAEFYMDPTHKQPIPPNLLAFIPEYYGFQQTKIIRLQEDKALHKETTTLIDVLKGVSPDYAIIAQKEGPAELTTKFSSLFANEYGLTLEVLAEKFHQQEIKKVEQYRQKIERAEAKTQAAEAKTQAADEKVTALLSSHSWRYTKPIRQLFSLTKRILGK